ncbi:MAG: hypothetical protein EBQ99_00140 [Planctomycetes bacterium]|nr:hypothetical protein [Planctomycetota bacterium]
MASGAAPVCVTVDMRPACLSPGAGWHGILGFVKDTRRHEDPDGGTGTDPAWLSAPPMRYQNGYAWLLLLSAADVMFTWHILRRGGEELNPVARLVIETWDLPGAIAFKFALVLFVIVSCEIVGRKRDRWGRGLIGTAVCIAAVPVAWSLVLFWTHGLLTRPAPVPSSS